MKIRTDFYRIMPQQVAKFVVEEITACQSFMRLICAQTTTTKTMDNFFFLQMIVRVGPENVFMHNLFNAVAADARRR